MTALRAADAAGDTAAAEAIARRIQTLKAAPAAGQPPQQGTPAPVEGMLDDKSGAWDRLKYGLGATGIQGYLGLKQSMGQKLTPEELDVLKMSKADVEKGGWWSKGAKMGGDVAGGIAATILAPQVAVPKAALFLKAALGAGTQAAALHPVEDQNHILEEKAKEGSIAALAGGALTGGAQLLKKGGTEFFKATEDAKRLFEQGVNPTLQQAAEGRFGRFVGGLTSGFSHVRKRQEHEVLDALTDRISGGNVSAPGGTVGERLGMLDTGVQKDYGAVLNGKKFPMTGKIRDEMMQQADAIEKSGGRFANQAGDARATMENILGTDRNAVRMNYDTMRERLLNPLSHETSQANDPMVKQALIDAKNVLIEKSRNSRLTSAEQDTLKEIDKRFFDLKRLEEAGDINQMGVDVNRLSKAYQNGPGMNKPGAINQTNEELVGPLVRTLGKTPRQDEARTAWVNAGRAAALFGAGTATGTNAAIAPLYAISALGQTGRGAKALTGQFEAQKALKSALESPQTGGMGVDSLSVANLLRMLRDNSTTLGAGLTGN